MPDEGGSDRGTGVVGRPRPSAQPAREHAAEPLLICLLGPVSMHVEGQPVPFPSPKARALFALLALEPGRPVSVGRLVDGLWGHDPPGTATATLQAYVSRLRRVLDQTEGEQDGIPAGAAVRILRRSPGYLLQVPADAVDVQRFLALSTAAKERLDLDPAAAVELLDRALRLVEGEPLADVVGLLGAAGATEARRLAERVLDARERLVDALLRTGDTDEALLRSADLLARHPLRESVQALHLVALYRAGRQAEALVAYEQFRKQLADELGADPGPQLRRLHARLLQQDAGLEAAPAPRSDPSTSGALSRGPTSLDVSVGREEPLRRLDDALAAAGQGRGSVWLVSGEAGIGKTTLCRDVAQRAQRRGFVTAWGRGRATAQGTPYWLWSQVLRTLPALWGQREVELVLGAGGDGAGALPAGSASGHRVQLHERLASQLAQLAGHERLVVFLEDLHWGDPLSLELVAAVAEVALGSPLVLVCTVREPELPVSPALTSLLARLGAGGAGRIDLTGLGTEEARTLLARRLRRSWAARSLDTAIAKAEGNPFFLLELARLLEERSSSASGGEPELGVPPTVVAVLRDRLAPLAAGTRRLLDVCAVIGTEVPLGLVEQVSGLSTEVLDAALAEAVGAGFVSERLLPTPGLTFSHALVREALYDEIRPLARARLHAAVGTAMTTAEDGTAVEELAGHLLAGAAVAGPVAALPVLLRASRRAASQLALEQAERLLGQALELTGRLPPGRERDGWELAVQARIGSAVAVRQGWGAKEANDALERAQHLALRAEPDAEMFAALYHRISWHVVTAAFDAALTLSDLLMERSAASGPTGQRFELLGRMTRGAVHWFRGDDVTATAELVRAVELATHLGPELVDAFREHPQTPVLGFLAQALTGSGHVTQGWEAAQRSLVLARQSHPAEAGGAVMFAALLAVAREDHITARRLAEELSGLARESGLGLQGHAAVIFHSWSEVTAPGGAPRPAAEALDRMRLAADRYFSTRARMLTPIVLTLLAEAELAQDEVDRSRTAVRAAWRAEEHGLPALWRARLQRLTQRLAMQIWS